MICTDSHASGNVQRGTTTFHDANPSYACEVDNGMDETRGLTDDNDVDFSKFFERPVKIHSLDWSVNSSIDILIYPWELWAENKRVANRLSNFKNFRGKLHIKILLNGNQFYWGRTIASYLPKNPNNPFLTNRSGDLYLSQLSQRPHLWIDPSSSQGGEMQFPFFYDEDCLNMTIANEFRKMGSLVMKSYVPLRQINGLSNPVSITIYAWCTDVQLTSPTVVSLAGLSPQAGTVAKDEYSDLGPVSKPATQISRAMNAISKVVPSIAPYTVPAASAAAGVAAAAKAMGYCKPRNLTDIAPLKIWQTSDLATIDSADTSQTLALTSKQGVSIDPKTTGLNDADEMDFKNIYSVESYLASATWGLTAAPDSPLISIPVTPMLGTRGAIALPASQDGTALAPSALVAAPFEYWRGKMKLRCQVVASGYHKGRLLVVWDPVSQSLPPEQNVQYSRIIDIADTKDFEFEVGWGASLPGLRVGNIPKSNTYSVGTTYNPNNSFQNGVVTIYVLNKLVSSGASTNPISLLVSTSFTELEAWAPMDEAIKNWSYFPAPAGVRSGSASGGLTPQAGVVQSDAVDTAENAAPEGAEPEVPMAKTSTLKDKLPLITHGEHVSNFRQILKRYQYMRTVSNKKEPVADKLDTFTFGDHNHPYYRGYDPSGINFYGAERFNYGPNNMHSWVTGCFCGYRGAMRYKIIPSFTKGSEPDMLECYRGDAARDNGQIRTYDDTDVNVQIVRRDMDESWEGAQRTLGVQGNVLDVEVPWYAPVRFVGTYFGSSTSSGVGLMVHSITRPNTARTTPFRQSYDIYRAIGEDFNVFFFAGVPPMWEVRPDPINT
jgi:hypothetical protein